MFPKSARYSFKKGLPKNVYKTPFFILRYQKNEKGILQVALVVSKKVNKLATKRNKLKRIFIDGLEKTIEHNMPFDLVFYLRKSAEGKGRDELSEEIKKAIKKII